MHKVSDEITYDQMKSSEDSDAEGIAELTRFPEYRLYPSANLSRYSPDAKSDDTARKVAVARDNAFLSVARKSALYHRSLRATKAAMPITVNWAMCGVSCWVVAADY